MKKIIILSISSLLWLSPLRGSLEGAFAQTITSPDGNIKVNLSVNSEGTPYYNITYNDAVVIQDSPLGLATSVGDFTKGLSLKSAGESKQVEGSYDLTNGKKAHFTFSANEQTVTYAKGNNNAFDVTFHVDNNNVAFRYMMYKQGNASGSPVMYGEQRNYRLHDASGHQDLPLSTDGTTGWFCTYRTKLRDIL